MSNEAPDRSIILETVRAGTMGLLPGYYEALNAEDADVDDKRKAIELGLKTLGMFQNEKMDNLPNISWVINGGNVAINVTQSDPPPADAPLPLVHEVAPVEPPAIASTPKAEFKTAFAVADSLLDSLP